jgi:hypothetical protein
MALRLGVFGGGVAVHGVRAVNLAHYLYCGVYGREIGP